MADQDNLENNILNNDGLAEKIRKYGDPKRNLIITSVLIVLMAILVAVFMTRKEGSGITSNYAVFYPDSTLVYIDAKLDNSAIKTINEATNLKIKNLPDLVSRLFVADYSDKNRQAANSLMTQAFGNTFSFGLWNDGSKERSLAIFTVVKEGKVRPLIETITGKREKLRNKNYKGYKIISSPGSNLAFSMIRQKLYVTDSVDSLTFIIDNYVLDHKKNLYSREKVRKSVGMLEQERIGTVVLTDFNFISSFLGNAAGKNYAAGLSSLKQITGSMDVTAVSVMLNNDLINLHSYTPYNLSNINSASVKKAFEAIFDNRKSKFNPNFLPEKTVTFVTVNDLRDYVRFIIAVSGLDQTAEYDQFKQFVKMITSLDFDRDILELLRKNTTLATIDNGSNKPEYAIIFSHNRNTSHVISKLMNVIPLQFPSSKISTTTYKNMDLGLVSIPKFSLNLCYGRISSDLYIVGEKLAVESVISTVTRDQKNITEMDRYKKLNLDDIEDSRIQVYLNTGNLDDINTKKIINRGSSFFDKVKNNTKAVLFTVKVDASIIRGSLELNIK